MSARLTRRQALGRTLAATTLLAAGCGASVAPAADPTGSTRASTYRDPLGTGQLTPGPGEPLAPRTELGPRAARVGVLGTFAHVTDAHVLDAQSPARVTFLDRLGPPFQSTFRPHETLTAQVLAGVLPALAALGPDLVIQGGDLIDNAQANELATALAVLGGGHVTPGSGGRGYVGVQSASDPDPFYYRPDLDAPRHPGLLTAATRPFRATGIRMPVLPVLGDHDVLVAGEIAPTPETRALALGGRAVWDLAPGLTDGLTVPGAGGLSPDGPPAPGLVSAFLARALQSPKVRVRADPQRRQLAVAEAVSRLRSAAGLAAAGARLDYHAELGDRVRIIVLDLARRAGGSGGLVVPGQADWLRAQLDAAGDRWRVVVSHQPLAGSENGHAILAQLDSDPRVLAAISGHTHRNAIVPRVTSAGGYWLISTASLIDFPQQARALRIVATAGGGAAIETWMLDHVPSRLGTISRALAYLDAQGGRPQGDTGMRQDRNVMLYRRPA